MQSLELQLLLVLSYYDTIWKNAKNHLEMINFVIIAILTFQTITMYVQNVEKNLAPDKIENENYTFDNACNWNIWVTCTPSI